MNHASEESARELARSGTTAVLLPASTFMLRATPPPVHALVDAGATIALATDFNPGTSPVLSMPEAIAIGCSLYGLDPASAITAATAGGAGVLGLDDRGSLDVGSRADFCVLDGGIELVPYRAGHNPVQATFIEGRLVSGAL